MIIVKLTKATEQALAIIAILSTQDRGIPVSSESIYTKLTVSPSYVKKLLRKLVVSDIISGVSGNNGGFSLRKDPVNINLLEIVEAIEGPLDSFPRIGVLQQAFSEFDEYATQGYHVITSCFEEADQQWKNSLENVSIQSILKTVFVHERQLPMMDWNKFKNKGETKG